MSSSQQHTALTEGVFVASKKRLYSEYVFDSKERGNGGPVKRKPGRRGPLSDSTREGVEKIKQEGGACWRCKILKKPCDGNSPCKQCANKDSKIWNIGCQRGNLQDWLMQDFPDIMGLCSGEFSLPIESGGYLRIKMKHTDSTFEFRDVDLSLFQSVPQPHSANHTMLLEFLSQFHDINSRFGDHYEHSNENLISRFAQIQEDLLSNTLPMPKKLPVGALIIAKSLRALAHTLNFSISNFMLPSEEPIDRFFQLEVIEDENFLLEVMRYDHVPETASSQLGQSRCGKLSHMIRDIIRTTQCALFQRHPRDWPALFCTLVLIRLFTLELRSYVDWMAPFAAAADNLIDIWTMLCQQYFVCTKGIHPLMGDWKRDEYASLVDDDPLSIDHFRSLNDIWINEGGLECADSEFEAKISFFIFHD